MHLCGQLSCGLYYPLHSLLLLIIFVFLAVSVYVFWFEEVFL